MFFTYDVKTHHRITYFIVLLELTPPPTNLCSVVHYLVKKKNNNCGYVFTQVDKNKGYELLNTHIIIDLLYA